MGKHRILLVDDEETFARVLQSVLERTGRYEVRIEHSGTAGLAAARTFQPDLVILDVIMPDLDGGAVAAAIQADAQLKHVPILFLTAVVSREEVRTNAKRIGGQLFLAKPISAKEVLACVERFLGDTPADETVGRQAGA